MKLNRKTVERVLRTVDKGLISGKGEYANPGAMCVEQAVAYATNEVDPGSFDPTDNPACVSYNLSMLKISLNDGLRFDSVKERARVLRRVAIAQLGSRNDGKYNLNWDRFRDLLTERLRLLQYELNYKMARTVIKDETAEKMIDVMAELERRDINFEKRAALREMFNEMFDTELWDSSVEYALEEEDNLYRFFNEYAERAVELRMFRTGEAALKWAVEQIVQVLRELRVPGTRYLHLTRAPVGPRL